MAAAGMPAARTGTSPTRRRLRPRAPPAPGTRASPDFRARPRSPRTASFGVVEDEAQRVAAARAQHADPMAHGRRRPAPARRHRPVASGEDEPVALLDGAGGASRLGAGPLLERDELSAAVVDPRPVEANDDLEGEHQL